MLIVNPRVESSFGGGKGTCDFYYSSEHLELCLLVSEETQWCSGLSLVPQGAGRGGWGGFTASGEISRAYFSHLILAFLKIEILH